MICRAIVNMQDWPRNDVRDVDPKDEQVQGLLRGQYIVPVVRPRSESTPSAAAVEPEPPKAKRGPAVK